MKKSLIAGAVALAFGGVAAAQSTTTLYGVVDGGLTHTQFKNKAGNKATLNGAMNGGQAGNRWGLRGSEDLGNGLRALYVLESGFNIATGLSAQGGRLFGREATVGLAGDNWGQVTLGRQPILAYRWFSTVATPFGIGNYQARAAGTFSVGQTRWDNQVQYQSPSFEGLQFGLGYSFNTNGPSQFKPSGGAQPNTRAWTSAVRYANGPLAAVLTYDSIKNAFTGAPATDVRASAWHLAGSYDFGVAKVHAGFGANRNGWVGDQPTTELRNPVLSKNTIDAFNRGFRAYSYSLGVSVPVDANSKVLASWGMVDQSKRGASGVAAADEKSQHIYSLGYNYSLSKRTNVYALASYGNNLVFFDGNKTRSLGVGLRHNF